MHETAHKTTPPAMAGRRSFRCDRAPPHELTDYPHCGRPRREMGCDEPPALLGVGVGPVPPDGPPAASGPRLPLLLPHVLWPGAGGQGGQRCLLPAVEKKGTSAHSHQRE